jgi:hypothetical protein
VTTHGTPGDPGGSPAGFLGPLILLVIGGGGLFILFGRRRGPGGDATPFGAARLVPAGATAGPAASIDAAMPPPPAPSPAPVAMATGTIGAGAATARTTSKSAAKGSGKAKRPPRGKAPKAAALAEAATVATAVARRDDATDSAIDVTTAATIAAPAAATAPPTAAPPAPEEVVDVAGATSWEVSDDAPLAATSAAYAATKAAVAATSIARTFSRPPGKGVDRATIRSRLVRFNAEPDDLRSAELGRLDRGDEVEIVGSFEGFLNVRVPDGTTGWIRRAAIV